MCSFSTLLTLCAFAVACYAKSIPKVIETEFGKIEGVYDRSAKLTAFYGVPYAKPPVKDLRFRPPLPPTPWNDTKKCTDDSYFKMCPQFHFIKNIFIGNEDCLYLNIYVPDAAAENPLSVMFWIYGGGYVLGDDNEFGWYRGKHLAEKQQVIVVEHNYRLGTLGLLAMPELMKTDGTTGNAGLLDQQAALRFTYRNIQKFGGDASRILIFGESAGAFSVCWHLVSPGSKGLFTRAIMESGTCDSAEFFISLQRAYDFSAYVLEKAKCLNSTDRVGCVQSAKMEDLFMEKHDWPRNETDPPLAPVMPYGPAIDGVSLLDRPLNLLQSGNFSKVPTIMGTNHDEGTLLMIPIGSVVPGASLPLNEKGYNLTLAHFFNDTTAQEVFNLYNTKDYKSYDNRVAVILRDFFFLCATRRAIRSVSNYVTDAYEYQFNFKMTNWVDYDLLGDYHTSELSFVFDNQWPPIVHAFGPKEKKMSETFELYWTNLAKFGNPNHDLTKDQAFWPTYNATTDYHMNMIVPSVAENHLESSKCDFWDTRYTKYYFD